MMRDRNAINFADAVQAPVLFLIGENDSRCPLRQAMAYVEKLEARGHPHEVYVFSAGHGSFDVDERAPDGDGARVPRPPRAHDVGSRRRHRLGRTLRHSDNRRTSAYATATWSSSSALSSSSASPSWWSGSSVGLEGTSVAPSPVRSRMTNSVRPTNCQRRERRRTR